MMATFSPSHGLIVIPTRIFGQQSDSIVRLALDTGASHSMINWDIAVFLGYDPASSDRRIQVTTGSGVEYAPRILIRQMEALSGFAERGFSRGQSTRTKSIEK